MNTLQSFSPIKGVNSEGGGGVLLGMVPSLILKCVRIQTDYLYAASCIDYIMLHTVQFNKTPKNIFYKSLRLAVVEQQKVQISP